MPICREFPSAPRTSIVQPLIPFCDYKLDSTLLEFQINHTVFTLCLTLFAQHNTFEIHPCRDSSVLLCISAIGFIFIAEYYSVVWLNHNL